MAYNRCADLIILSLHTCILSCNFLLYLEDICSSDYEFMDNRKGAAVYIGTVTFISRFIYFCSVFCSFLIRP